MSDGSDLSVIAGPAHLLNSPQRGNYLRLPALPARPGDPGQSGTFGRPMNSWTAAIPCRDSSSSCPCPAPRQLGRGSARFCEDTELVIRVLLRSRLYLGHRKTPMETNPATATMPAASLDHAS